MTAKEQLIEELEQTPDFLIEEVLNFLLFIKTRVKQKNSETKLLESSESSNIPSFLRAIEEISSHVPSEEWGKLPKDLSKNLDHYLYGSPKVEE